VLWLRKKDGKSRLTRWAFCRKPILGEQKRVRAGGGGTVRRKFGRYVGTALRGVFLGREEISITGRGGGGGGGVGGGVGGGGG